MPRLFNLSPLACGQSLSLTPSAAQHARVLRLQPGDAITVFNGLGGEYAATVQRMGKQEVQVQVGEHRAVEREAARPLHLAVALMANERMDWLVEKATELGAASLQPIISSRCVLRLEGERADKRIARWELAAMAACEQCGRNQLMRIHPIAHLGDWLKTQASTSEGAARSHSAGTANTRAVLSLSSAATSATNLRQQLAPGAALTLLTGPEGGLSEAEEAQALAAGFIPISLGPRVLRAETAAVAAAVVFGLD
jgi:16S rRNA (uracil1498-N3)-methyltransferase